MRTKVALKISKLDEDVLKDGVILSGVIFNDCLLELHSPSKEKFVTKYGDSDLKEILETVTTQVQESRDIRQNVKKLEYLRSLNCIECRNNKYSIVYIESEAITIDSSAKGTGRFILGIDVTNDYNTTPIFITPIQVQFTGTDDGEIEYEFSLAPLGELVLFKEDFLNQIVDQIHFHIDEYIKTLSNSPKWSKGSINIFNNVLRMNYMTGRTFTLRDNCENNSRSVNIKCYKLPGELYKDILN